MKALVVPNKDIHTIKEVEWQERPKPELKADEVLIKTMAVGLNPVDYKVFTSSHPNWQYPHTLGLDVAGIVEAVGGRCDRFSSESAGMWP